MNGVTIGVAKSGMLIKKGVDGTLYMEHLSPFSIRTCRNCGGVYREENNVHHLPFDIIISTCPYDCGFKDKTTNNSDNPSSVYNVKTSISIKDT